MDNINLTFKQENKPDENGKFVCVAATNDIITHVINGEQIRLRLDIESMDLSRFSSGSAPLLFDHNPMSKRLGVIESVSVDSGKLLAQVKLSRNEDGKNLERDLADGIHNEFSVGIRFAADGLDYSEELDLFTITGSQPYELSVTNIAPANAKCTLVEMFSQKKTKLDETNKEIFNMSKETKIDLEAALAADRTRCIELDALAAKFGVDATEAKNSGMTVEAFALAIAKDYEAPKAEEKTEEPATPAIVLNRTADTEEAATAKFSLDAFLRQAVLGENGAEIELATEFGKHNGNLVLTNEMLFASVTGSGSIQGKSVANPAYPLSDESVLATAGFTIHNTVDQVSVPVPAGVTTDHGIAEGGAYNPANNELGSQTLNAVTAAVATTIITDRLVRSGGAVSIFQKQILDGLDSELNAWLFENVNAQVANPTPAAVTEDDLLSIVVSKQSNMTFVMGRGMAKKLAALQLEAGSGMRAYDFRTGTVMGRKAIVTDAVGDLELYCFQNPSDTHILFAGGVQIDMKPASGSLGSELVGSIYFDSKSARPSEVKRLTEV